MIKEGWSTKTNMVIWEKLRLPCCLGFRRIKYRENDIAVTGGYCRTCTTSIAANLSHHSNILRISITNFNPRMWHDMKLKRRVLPCEREDLEKKLDQKTAYIVRSELADAASQDGKIIAPHIPNLNTLTKIRSRNQCPKTKSNAIISLYDMRKEHVNCIHRIDYFPFTVYYSSPAQKAYYKKEAEYHRDAIISVDASGVGLRSPTDNDAYILLYVICVQGMKLFQIYIRIR